MRETRLSFIGDELVAGHGDGRALGWTGRVMARTPRDADILWTSLAVPGETTAQMSDRWGPEVARRSTHTGINRLVVGLGVAGIGQIEGHILQPLIMGRQVSMHPVVVIIAVAVGTYSAGLLGAIVAVPLVSVLWSVYSELHVRDAPVVGELPSYSGGKDD